MERPRSPYVTGWAAGGLGLSGSYSKRRLYNQLALETPSARRQAERASAAGLLGRTTSPTLLRHQETARRRFQSLNAQPDPPPLARHSAARVASREGRSRGPPCWGPPPQDANEEAPLRAPFACRSPRSSMQPTSRSSGFYKGSDFECDASQQGGTRLVPLGSSSPCTSAALKPPVQDSIRRKLETPRWGNIAEGWQEKGDTEQKETPSVVKDPNSDKQRRAPMPQKVGEQEGPSCHSEKEGPAAPAVSSQRRAEGHTQQRPEAPLPEAAPTHAHNSGSPNPHELRRGDPSPERDAERSPFPGESRRRDTDGDGGDTEGHAPSGDLHDNEVQDADRVAWRVAELQREAQAVLGRETRSSRGRRRGASPVQHAPYLTTGFGASLDVTELVEKMRARDEMGATLETIRHSLSSVSVSERAAHKAEVLGLQTKAQNYYLLYRKVLERQAPLEAEIKRLRQCLEEERANSRRPRQHSSEAAPVAAAEGSPKGLAKDGSKRELGPTIDVHSSVLLQSLLGVCHSLVPVFAREAQFCGEETDPSPGSPNTACMLRVIDFVAASSHLNPAVEQARRELAAALRGRRTTHAAHWPQQQQHEKPFSFSSPRGGRGRDREIGLLQPGGSRARSRSDPPAASLSPPPVSPQPHWQLGLQEAAKGAGDKARETAAARLASLGRKLTRAEHAKRAGSSSPEPRHSTNGKDRQRWDAVRRVDAVPLTFKDGEVISQDHELLFSAAPVDMLSVSSLPTGTSSEDEAWRGPTLRRPSLLQRRACKGVGEKDVLAKARLVAAAFPPSEDTRLHARQTPRNRGFRGLSPLLPKGAPQQQRAGGQAALPPGKKPHKKVTYLLPPAEPQGRSSFFDPLSSRPQPGPPEPTPAVASIQQQQQQRQHAMNLPLPEFSPAASSVPSPLPPAKAADLVPPPKAEASPLKMETPAAPKTETVAAAPKKETPAAAPKKEAHPPAQEKEAPPCAPKKATAAVPAKEETTSPSGPQEADAKAKDKQLPPSEDGDTKKETPSQPQQDQPKAPEEQKPMATKGPVALRLSHLKSLKGEDPNQRTFQFVLHGAKEDPLVLAQQQAEGVGLVTERHTTRLEPNGGPPRVCNVEEELTIPAEKEEEGVCLSIIEFAKDGSSRVFATSGKLPLETVVGGPMNAEIDIRKATPSGDKETVARLVATLGRASQQQQQQQIGAATTAASKKTPGGPVAGTGTGTGEETKSASPTTKSKEAKQQQSRAAAAAAAKRKPEQQAPKESSEEGTLVRKFSEASLARMRALMEANSGDRDGGDDPGGEGSSEKRRGRLRRLLRGTGLRLRLRKKSVEGRDRYKDPEVRRRVRELIEAGIWKTGDEEEFELVLDEEAGNEATSQGTETQGETPDVEPTSAADAPSPGEKKRLAANMGHREAKPTKKGKAAKGPPAGAQQQPTSKKHAAAATATAAKQPQAAAAAPSPSSGHGAEKPASPAAAAKAKPQGPPTKGQATRAREPGGPSPGERSTNEAKAQQVPKGNTPKTAAAAAAGAAAGKPAAAAAPKQAGQEPEKEARSAAAKTPSNSPHAAGKAGAAKAGATSQQSKGTPAEGPKAAPAGGPQGFVKPPVVKAPIKINPTKKLAKPPVFKTIQLPEPPT